MNKELQVLEDLKEFVKIDEPLSNYECCLKNGKNPELYVDECFDTIKQALTRLQNLEEFVKHYNDYKERISILKFANRSLVEENENYANEIYNLHDRNDRLCNRLDKQKAKISKLEKAIEICTNKSVNFYFLKMRDNFHDYNADIISKYCYVDDKLLTEEEFNLLKEAFGK